MIIKPKEQVEKKEEKMDVTFSDEDQIKQTKVRESLHDIKQRKNRQDKK